MSAIYATHSLVRNTETFCDSNGLLEASDIVIGLSGGPDSVALICVLKEILDKRGINLCAVHINHGLRDLAADQDEELAKVLCLKLGVEFTSVKVDVRQYAQANKISEETAGRILRYRQFDKKVNDIIEANPSAVVRIAVAHHADDLAETFMMNLFRGAGLEGLCSPLPISQNIIRPFLSSNKCEIKAFLEEFQINYAVDSTNDELCCTRNGWRNKVLPAIGEISVKSPSKAISDTYNLLYQDLKYIENAVEEQYHNICKRIGKWQLLPTDILNSEPRAIASRLIRKLWGDTFGNLTDFERQHLDLVLDFVSREHSRFEVQTLDLSFARQCLVYDNYLGFVPAGQTSSVLCALKRNLGFVLYESPISVPILETITVLPDLPLSFLFQKIENTDLIEYNNMSWFLPVYDENLDNRLFLTNGLRNRYMCKAGSSSGKVLNRMFCDLHIPSDIRDFVVGVTDSDGNVLWIPGVGHQRGFVSELSKRRLLEINGKAPLYVIKVTLNSEGNHYDY